MFGKPAKLQASPVSEFGPRMVLDNQRNLNKYFLPTTFKDESRSSRFG